jgi:phosphoribosyl 1,2-cyclic phosphodiesterase
MYKVINTGSQGNAVIYQERILVDCGVPFSFLKDDYRKLAVVLLTHEHADHINKATLTRLSAERPGLRFAACEWMAQHLEGLRNIDILNVGVCYNYGTFQVSPVQLYHDVPNCGWRIYVDGLKIFHATDTAHLEGIVAIDYDLYAIEHNYDEETVYDIIAAKTARGEYAHQKGSLNSHLSEQQAKAFIFRNMKSTSQVLRLHESMTVS